MPKVIVKCNGTKYDGFKSASIKSSIDAISSSFSLDFKDSWSPKGMLFGLNPQDEVTIEIAGQKIITGYIDSFDGALKNASTYGVSGRDKSADLVDCDVPPKPSQFLNITLLALCNALSSDYGVPFRLGLGLPSAVNTPFTKFTLNPAEGIFEALERACRLKGVLMIPDGLGSVVISSTGLVQNLTPLIEGINIKSISYKIDMSKRYSQYIVRGQDHTAQGFQGTATSVRGEATDAGVRRKRLKVIHADGKVDNNMAKARAQWEATVRAARSLSIQVDLYEWTDSAGLPWRLNELVTLKAPKTGVSGTFLIASRDFSFDENGSTTSLTLMRPDAFTSEPVVPKQKQDQVAKGFHSR